MKPQLAIRYFQCFAEKDLASLEVLFADDVMITDWEGQALGKAAVLAFSKTLFTKLNSIEIDIKRIALGQECVIAEIAIIVNRESIVHVVDVIEFDLDDKIKSIRAYKR